MIPADPNTRQIWAQTIFNPLTQYIMTEIAESGSIWASRKGCTRNSRPSRRTGSGSYSLNSPERFARRRRHAEPRNGSAQTIIKDE